MKKISEICKNTRLLENLSMHGFANQRGVSHTYIKKIEDGLYDNNPSALIMANIFKTYQFDISMIEAMSNVNKTEAFINEIEYYMVKGYKGTAQISNSYNVLQMFIKEYLEKNGFFDIKCIDKKSMKNKKNKELISGFLVPDIECAIKCKDALNGFKDVYVFLIDSLSTIKTTVDKQKINDIIFTSIKTIVFNDEFIEDNNVIYYLTSSEKIFDYIYKTFQGSIRNLSQNKNEIYVALCRPKRKIETPKKLF